MIAELTLAMILGVITGILLYKIISKINKKKIENPERILKNIKGKEFFVAGQIRKDKEGKIIQSIPARKIDLYNDIKSQLEKNNTLKSEPEISGKNPGKGMFRLFRSSIKQSHPGTQKKEDGKEKDCL